MSEALTKQEILLKHYDIQQTALNEIKEMIALFDMNTMNEQELLRKIDDVAAYASQVDLTNPHGQEDAYAYIAALPYDPARDIASQA